MPAKSVKSENKKFAFALGGLAGNNAHGAAFLQAALDAKREPTLISCTSGQIRWTYEYLIALDNYKKKNISSSGVIHNKLEKFVKSCAPTPVMEANLAKISALGVDGKFGIAYMDAASEMWANFSKAWVKTLKEGGRQGLLKNFIDVAPAQSLLPYVTDAECKEMADVINSSKIGIMFNAFDIRTGQEIVYMNEAADNPTKLLSKKTGTSYRSNTANPSSSTDRTVYQPCTKEAIYDALWLLQYGFGARPTHMRRTGVEPVDGAYFRQIIMSELAVVPLVFAVRPICHSWIGPLPTSYFHLEDMKTELWFNGSYQGERDNIMLINKLIGPGGLLAAHAGPGMKYQHIDIVEIETTIQSGYLDYIFERMEVYNPSYQQSFDRLMAETAQNYL